MLASLLERGDVIYIQSGRLVLEPASGKEVPVEWIKKHSKDLVIEIIDLCNMNALFFESWSVGKYKVSQQTGLMKAGLTINFVNHKRLPVAYTIFNVVTDRVRKNKNGEAGTPLKDRQFRVTVNMAFYKFWLTTGLALPPRLSAFPDYMGNLKKVIFTGEYGKGSRLKCESILPLEVSHEQILQSSKLKCTPNILQTNSKQMSNNLQTIYPNMDLARVVMNKGLEQNESTCHSKCGNKVNSEKVTRDNFNGVYIGKSPYDQTVDEWLADNV